MDSFRFITGSSSTAWRSQESLDTLPILWSQGNPLGARGLGCGTGPPEPHNGAGEPCTRSRSSGASCSLVSLTICSQRHSSVLSTTGRSVMVQSFKDIGMSWIGSLTSKNCHQVNMGWAGIVQTEARRRGGTLAE